MTQDQIENRIRNAYPNCQVAALDLTGTQNHFEVRLHIPELASLSRIALHRAIMDLFQDELASGEVHALAIKPVKL